MYFVKYGKEYLHDPRIDGYMLLDLSLDCEENSCGYCDFTIYPNHPMYDKLIERDPNNQVEVYDDDILLFTGFIYELGKEFYLDGHVKCKGELAYLNDSIVRPYSTVQRGYGDKAPDTLSSYFQWLIDQHNAQVSSNKQFTVGINQAGSLSTSLIVYRENDQYPTTMSEITEKLIDLCGGYIRVRHENGIRYIDYLSEWSDANAQVLDFGVNLTDYSQTDDSENIATYVVPTGARMRDTDYDYDDGYFKTSDTAIDISKVYYTESWNYQECYGLTAFESGVTYYELNSSNEYVKTSDTTVKTNKRYYVYVFTGYTQCNNLSAFESGVTYYEYDPNEDESDLLLTLSSMPDGSYLDQGYRKSGDMIYHESSANKYGLIGATYSNTDIFTVEDLLVAGTNALKELVSPKRTIEIKAVDMHFINPNIKPIKIGEFVRVRSKPHKLDSYFICREISLDLNNPENSIYTLGTTFDTLTGQQNKKINELNAAVNQRYEAAVAISDEAKKNAQDALSAANKASTDASIAKEAADSAVLSVVEEYAISLNRIAIPTEGWSSETPSDADKYIWHRTVVTYGDGSVVTGEPALLTGPDGEDAVLLRIDSTRGTVFKNNSISTVLNVVIYNGPNRITNITELHDAFGSGAYLQWYWQKIDDDTFGIISSTDSMLSNDGFSLTISADEVDTKVTFMCELII